MKNLEDVLKKINSMSREEFNSKFLHLNGIMTEQKLNHVMKKIDLLGYVDSDTEDSIHEDFVDVFHYVEKYISEEQNIDSEFPTCIKLFSYCGLNYQWRLVVGQGSLLEISTYNHKIENIQELKVDPNIKFFKRIG